jgi:hypothetical protein
VTLEKLTGLISQTNHWLTQNPTPWSNGLIIARFHLADDGVLTVQCHHPLGVWQKAVGAGEWESFLERISK